MLKKKILILALLLFLGTGFALPQVRTDSDSELDNALKIINFLEEIEKLRQATGRSQGKTVEFEEREVSSFFQYLFKEQVPAVKALELKLLPGNKIEGHLLLDLSGYNLPSYFKNEINLYFAARAECQKRKVRLNFQSLFLETQKIEPRLIDYLIDLISASLNQEAHHLEDWYELPFGVEKISVGQGKMKIYY